MAMTMAETVSRKACDRCHGQKISCKRIKDDKCERCKRLNTECKTSPSLRSKKQQQQQHQQPQQNCHTPSEQALNERRSPKRRRTGSDPSVVLPDTALPIVSHPAGLIKSHPAVTPDPALEINDFNFNFEQLGLVGGDYLSHHGLPVIADNQSPSSLHHHHQPLGAFADSWDPNLTSSDVYPLVAPEPLLPQPATDESTRAVVLQEASRSCVSEHSSSDKRLSQRARQCPRQIHLAARADTTPLLRDAPLIHWMAQLTDINARLLDLSSALPSHEVTQNGPLCALPVEDKFKGNGFPIDEMFKLTRRVADVLEQTPPEPSEAIDSSDPGNAMFILSTYMRLLDMYQKVFSLVHAELSQTSSNTLFQFWKLPEVTVGSFTVESSPFLQMSLTIQLAEEFLERLRGLASRWSGVAGGSMFSDVVDISFQAFKEREEKLAGHLVGLRGEIEALLDG